MKYPPLNPMPIIIDPNGITDLAPYFSKKEPVTEWEKINTLDC